MIKHSLGVYYQIDLSALTNMIPFLKMEALIAGECVPMPVKGIIDEPMPRPNSNDVSFSQAWKRIVNEYDINNTLYRWWEVQNHE